jgi:hypothetical protein
MQMKASAVIKKGTQSRKGAILENDFMKPTNHVALPNGIGQSTNIAET